MDDPTRTQKTLDKLADLFLTNVTGTPSSGSDLNSDRAQDPQPLDLPRIKPTAVSALREGGPHRGRDARRDLSSHGPAGAWPIAGSITDPPDDSNGLSGLVGTAAVTPESQGRRVSPPPPPEAQETLDAPAAKTRIDYGRGVEESMTQAHAHSQKVRVEAVLLGNLPGTGGPWLTQYAQRLAKERGTVGLLSVDEQAVDVELITARRHRSLTHTKLAEPHGNDPQALTQVLTTLSQSEETGPIRTWLIHVPTPIDMQSFGRAWELPRWTLLCGADDAAVVGAYRTLKQLCVSPWADRLDGYDHPRVGVMVMGSDESAARGVAIKLNHTANSFLDTPVELVGWQKQMQPVSNQPIGRFFSDDQDLWSQVQVFLHDITNGFADTGKLDTRGDQEDGSAKTPEAHAATQEMEGLSAEVEQFTMPDNKTIQPDAAEGGGITPVMLETLDDTEKTREPSIDSDPQPRASTNGELDLTGLLPFDAVLLEARCPMHERIGLMLDEEGRLHLVACDTAGGEPYDVGTDGAARLHALVVDLMHTRDWVRQHFELLQMAHADRLFDPQAQPVLRLFTDQAKAAVALVGQLGTKVKLHLLQKAVVGQTQMWCGCELN